MGGGRVRESVAQGGGWRLGDVRRGYGVQSPLRRLGVAVIVLLARLKRFRSSAASKQQRHQKAGGRGVRTCCT